MRRLFPVILAVLLFSNSSVFVSATEFDAAKIGIEQGINIDEIELEVDENNVQSAGIEEDVEPKEKTLVEKLQDIKKAEYYDYKQKNFLLHEVFTHRFPEKSKMDYTQFWAGYNGAAGLKFSDDGKFTNHYDVNSVNVGIDGVFKDNNADFRLLFGIPVRKHQNFVGAMFSDVYVATNKIPHHRVILGYTRTPVGKEGGNSAYTLPFLNRAQIARNFGNVRKVGTRVIGDYDFIDYDLGVYSSASYFQSFFPGAEFVGWVNLKPLAKTEGKYGNLKIGGGIQGGKWHNDFFVTGAYVGYEYKRFMANFEWSQANGYNGSSGHMSRNHASGFYTTVGYMLTKKLQLIARYDQFDPNHNIKHDNRREYTLGLNYFIKGQALRLILNYVFCQNDSARDSHRIMLGTQILL